MLNFYRLPQDYLKFKGTDRLDLINRLSTNTVNSTEKFHKVKTVLTSDKGRFIDLLTLYNFGDFVFSECSFNNSASVAAHLDKYTIMDDFFAEDLSGTHEAILFFGDNSAGFLESSTNCKPGELTDDNFLITDTQNTGHDAIVSRNDDSFGGFKFIYSVKDKDFWDKIFFNRSNSEEYQLKELTGKEYDVKRIELGIPGFGSEMTLLTNPLECGLNKYVSFTKGCYIGQEVIARLDAYDKINKHMTGIKLNSNEPVEFSNQFKITLDAKECGFVTSSVYSGKYGSIGIGFVKTIFLDYSKAYKLRNNDIELDCRIVKLPFN